MNGSLSEYEIMKMLQGDHELLRSVVSNERVTCDFPDETLSKRAVKPDLTPEILAGYLAESGIVARFNEVTKCAEYSGLPDENAEQLAANIAPLLCSRLQSDYRRCNFSTVEAYLNIILSRNAYNPVIEIFKSTTWDKKDRLQEIYEILAISETDTLSRALIRKWCLQCVALLFNDFEQPFGAEGVLVLQGAQGIGKTSFFRQLALQPAFFKEGVHLDFSNRDTIIRSLSCWLCELGELESTLKKDIEKLKAYITQSIDEYRKPYGRGDVRSLRRTSFCASCNSEQFLIDISGNRRFWTIPVKQIDLDRLKTFNTLQFWTQMYENIKAEGLQAFRLTQTEFTMLNERNVKHEKPLKCELEILDILNDSDGENYKIVYELMTLSQFKEINSSLRSFDVRQISVVLRKLGFEQTRTRKGRFYRLPRRKYPTEY